MARTSTLSGALYSVSSARAEYKDNCYHFEKFGDLALGFRSASRLLDFPLRAVVYKQKTKEMQVRIFFHYYYLAFQRDSQTYDKDKVLKAYRDLIIPTLYDWIVLYKKRKFKKEQEYRLIYAEHPEVGKGMVEVPRLPKLSYPSSEGKCRLYVHTAAQRFPLPRKLPLEKIIIGPKASASISLTDIKEFLELKGYDEVQVHDFR